MKTASIIAALELAKASLGGTDSVLPILSHYVFMGDVLYAYNDVTAVVVEEATGLECAVHGDTLLAMLKAGPAEEWKVAMEADGILHIAMARGYAELPTLPLDGAAFTMPEEALTVELPVTLALVTALERVMLSVGQDSLKAEFSGVTFELKPGAGALMLFTTDNHRASVAEIGIGKVGKKAFVSAVMAPQAVQLLLKLAEAKGAGGTLAFGRTTAVVTFGETVPITTMVAKLLPAAPEHYHNVFEAHAAGDLYSLPDGLVPEITRASTVLAREPVQECYLTVGGGQLHVAAQGSLGKLSTRVPVPDAPKAAKGAVNVDPAHVAAVLPFCTVVGINDARSLVLAADGFTTVISSRPNVEAPPDKPAAAKRAPKIKPRTTGIPADADDDIPF